jgi:phosphate transport system ATP-binding protein
MNALGSSAASPEIEVRAATPAPVSSRDGASADAAPAATEQPAVSLREVSIYYGAFRAVKGVTIGVERNQITALIGPSGCGKSTLLRSINRMNDLIPTARVEGEVLFHGENLYAPHVDPVEVRRRIGMVFQKPNPFPKSIYDNVAFGPRLMGRKKGLDGIVEDSLRRAALWDDVKDKLKQSGLALSGGQQQRLCIARTIAIEPEVILFDEPCSALDPIATAKIEELMQDLKDDYTQVIVTHTMQQASRVSDLTAFLYLGELIEMDLTEKIFLKPAKKQTEDYITGRFG